MIYAANFKTNHTRGSTKKYMQELAEAMHKVSLSDRIIVFPPTTALDAYEGRITVGAQNCYPAFSGAFTGEIGIEQLEEFSIDTILIGHSERRVLMGENQELISKKYKYFKEKNFEIIYCIGEPLDVRELGSEAVAKYLMAQFDDIDIEYERLVVAYEPIWAIGTGRSATKSEIESIHKMLKEKIGKPILYGGSVKGENIAEIASIDGVDGVLVGGASIKVNTFMDIVLDA